VLERFHGKDGKPVASLIDVPAGNRRTHQHRVHLAMPAFRCWRHDYGAVGFKTKGGALAEAARLALEGLGRRPCYAIYCGAAAESKGRKLEFLVGNCSRSRSDYITARAG
jgi:23S rRNA pseudouridine1911/1915/1917 synthase